MAVERLERTADNMLVQDFWKLFLILGLALHLGSLKMAGQSMLCCVNATLQLPEQMSNF